MAREEDGGNMPCNSRQHQDVQPDTYTGGGAQDMPDGYQIEAESGLRDEEVSDDQRR
jgi:hypothetical protein